MSAMASSRLAPPALLRLLLGARGHARAASYTMRAPRALDTSTRERPRVAASARNSNPQHEPPRASASQKFYYIPRTKIRHGAAHRDQPMTRRLRLAPAWAPQNW